MVHGSYQKQQAKKQANKLGWNSGGMEQIYSFFRAMSLSSARANLSLFSFIGLKFRSF
jgi:hypothetical protein